MKNNYVVYEHKNKLNNKRYIGITSQKVKERWKRGSSYSKNTKIYKAIQKYGWDGFEHIILFENLTQKEAEQKEIELIKAYKTTEDKYGYNIQNGGNSNGKFTQETKDKISKSKKGKKMSNYTKKKMSESRKGKLHWNYGKKTNAQTIEKMKKSHIGQVAWNKGKKRKEWLSKENEILLKEKQKKAMLGNKFSCKPIVCIETDVVYEGVLDAQKKTKINASNISMVCNNKRKSAGGFHWKYIDERDDELLRNVGMI